MLPSDPTNIDIRTRSDFEIVHYCNLFILTPNTNLLQWEFYRNCVDELFDRGVDCSVLGNPDILRKAPEHRYFLHRSKLYRESEFKGMIWILLHFRDGWQWEFGVRVLYVDTPVITINAKHASFPLLLIIRHPYPHTLVNTYGSHELQMAVFDEQGYFEAFTLLHHQGEARSRILSGSRSAMLHKTGWHMIQWDYYEIWEKGMENRGYVEPEPPLPRS